MSENYELPNVDIFDPVMTAKYWAKCATQQEINVYLNKQIDINRKLLIDTIKAQNDINGASKTKLADHDSRIATLESEVKALDTAQTNLNSAFQALQTDNNNFKSNVDLLLNQYQTTINLLQQNIDKITTSNEQLWNEVNKLKSQFDPDKLDAAIAGYDSLLKDSKAYTDSEAAKLQTAIDKVASDLQNANATLQQMIQDNNISWTSNFDSYRNSVNADLESQNQRITSFIQNTDNVLQLQRTWLTNEIDRVDKRIDSLTSTVATNKKASEDRDTALGQRITQEVEQLNQQITDLGSAQAQVTEGNRQDSEDRDTALGKRIDDTNTEVDALKTSDGKQWDTINSILEAQNRINTNMENLYKYVNEQIELVKTDIASNTSSIEQLQTGSQTLELRAERLEQRTGFKFKATAKADNSGATTYNVGFGNLTFTATTTQVSFVFNLASGVSGLVSVKDTAYGMYQVLGNTSYNVINNAAQPNVIEGRIIGYAGSLTPVAFVIWYDPATATVTFQCQYETLAEVMPKDGDKPQTV